MDKNTLWGLLCMAAIFFGFMYMQPKPEKPTQTAAQATTHNETQTPATASADSLSEVLEAQLIQAVHTLGVTDDNGVTEYKDGVVALKADSANLSGTISTAKGEVVIAALRHTASDLDSATRTEAMAKITALVADTQRYRGLARNLGGQNTVTVLENDLVRVGINSRGAMVSSVKLKKYLTETTSEPEEIELFRGASDGYSFILTTSDQRLDTRDFNFTPVVENDSTVMMTLALGDGSDWGIRYTLRPGSYVVGMDIVQHGALAVLPASTSAIDFRWHQTMARNEKGRTFEERNSAIYYKYVGDTPDDLSATADKQKQLNGRIKWVAFKNQFFSSVIIPRTFFTSADLDSRQIKSDLYLKDMLLEASMPYTTADGEVAGFDFYFGPNDYPLLSRLSKDIEPDEDLQLTRLIPLGWGLFRYINTWIVIPVFTFLSSFISNYGLIILLLTIFIKLIIFPFTYKSFKSQARMRVLQPEIKEINEKWPGDENAMKRQQETMSLYSRCGASPFSGCLPMLFQMPVLIAMFSFFPSAIELRGQSFLWAHDLSAPDFIITLPFTIPFYGNGVSLFCLLMTVVNVVYMHINMQNQPGGNSMPGMKMMTYVMPVMFLFIFNDYASGLSYYYFLSLLITIVQTWLFRHCIDEKKVRAQLLENAKKPRKKSGLMARLEEAQRQQQAMLRQQQAAQGKKRR